MKIVRNNGLIFYIGIANPLDLLKVSYVARRERGDQRYYQRMIMSEKLGKLTYYIHKERKEFYNNVILAVADGAGLQFDSKSQDGRLDYGILNMGNLGSSFWIIDGQHRLYGFTHTLKKILKVQDQEISKISRN
ncbi:hypothetical protein B1A_15257 [mine drainage metagenome]|uniref:DGQHR domain protein n=1 Tax=mine drainage metagenome TaxID=410659 RepID=T0ZGR5_9ZZZZ